MTDSMADYFIAPDAYGYPCIWRKTANGSAYVLTWWALRDYPAVWRVLVDAVSQVAA